MLCFHFRCALRHREHGLHKFVISTLCILVFHNVLHKHGSEVLYVQNKFGWDVVAFTNYHSVFSIVFAFEAFAVTPFFTYVIGMHDCLVSALGNFLSGAYFLTFVSCASFPALNPKSP